MNEVRTLHCQLGDHAWTRPSQRGRLPLNCPNHQPVKVVVEKSEQVGTSAARIRQIENLLADRGTCSCDIRPTMTDDELMTDAINCCSSVLYVCSTLDKVRRHVIDYGRHDQALDELEANDV